MIQDTPIQTHPPPPPLSSCVPEQPPGCPGSGQVCALPSCVCVPALSGGALNRVQLHDLLILELSSFKNKLFLKLAKLLNPPTTSLPGPHSDSGIRADAAVESVLFLSSE